MAATILILSDVSDEDLESHRSEGWAHFLQIGVRETARAAGLAHRVVAPEALAGGVLEKLLEDPPACVVAIHARLIDEALAGALDRLRGRGVPAAIYGYGPALESYDTVASDHEHGSYCLTRWLVQRRRRRLLRVWHLAQHATGGEHWLACRDRGYERAVREAGLQPFPALRLTGRPGPTSGEEYFLREKRQVAEAIGPFLSRDPPVDGIVAATDSAAIMTAAACRDLGFVPQEDVLIVGYDNYWLDCEERKFEKVAPLATADKRNMQMGRELVELALARRDGRLPDEPIHRLVKPEMVVIATRR